MHAMWLMKGVNLKEWQIQAYTRIIPLLAKDFRPQTPQNLAESINRMQYNFLRLVISDSREGFS